MYIYIYKYIYIYYIQSLLDTLFRSAPYLRRLTMEVWTPSGRGLQLFAMHSETLEMLDVSACRGFYLESLDLPNLQTFKVSQLMILFFKVAICVKYWMHSFIPRSSLSASGDETASKFSYSYFVVMQRFGNWKVVSVFGFFTSRNRNLCFQNNFFFFFENWKPKLRFWFLVSVWKQKPGFCAYYCVVLVRHIT